MHWCPIQFVGGKRYTTTKYKIQVANDHSLHFTWYKSDGRCRAVDMSYNNLGPISGQVLQRPKEGTSAVLDVLGDGNEHLVLGSQVLLVRLVAGELTLHRALHIASSSPPSPSIAAS